MTWLLVAGLGLLVAGLAWVIKVLASDLKAARLSLELRAREADFERERSIAEIERRTAERARELEQRTEVERLRWVEQERGQVVADAEARSAVRFEVWRREHEEAIRKDAVARSTAVVRGNVSEQLLPFMDVFPYDPRDCRFLGSPIDLIVFNGLYGDGLKEIVFLEVKTGESSLSPRERAVRDAIRAKMVRWDKVKLSSEKREN